MWTLPKACVLSFKPTIANFFKFRVARTFKSSLMRQIWEAVKIHGSKATIVLNSKAEWMQPAIDRIVVTREPQDRQQQPGGGGARRRWGGQ